MNKIWTNNIKPAINKITRFLLSFTSDTFFISIWYRIKCKSFPSLNPPKTFNEKIQWYKLNYRHPILTQVCDKYEVRNYISELNLGHILNQIYGIYENPKDIDFDILPNQFVLKATHGWSMNIICKDKKQLDYEAARKKLDKWMKINHYHKGREWAYKNIPPRIICEKYLENKEYSELLDYKFYCFAGKPYVVFVCEGRYSAEGVRYTAYNMNWERQNIFKGKGSCKRKFNRPDNFNEMIEVCRKLSENFPFVRIDLYSVENQTYFGELTFYPDSGFIPFQPEEYNLIFGEKFIIKEHV